MNMAAGSEYNQRESDNLMNIVAVVYGVALTTALTRRADVLLSPLSAPYVIPSLALLGAVLLTALSFLGYVLAIGGDTPYHIAWTAGSGGGHSVFRYLADLLLAGLYVRLLFAATDVETGPDSKPRLASLVLAYTGVFAGAIVVRLLRRGQISWLAAAAAVATLVAWFWVRGRTPTRAFDLWLEAALLAGVILYGWLTHWLGYRAWTRAHPAAEQAAADQPGPVQDE